MSSITSIGPRLTPVIPIHAVQPIRRLERKRTEIIRPDEEIFRFGEDKDWARKNEINGHLAYIALTTGLIAGVGEKFFIKEDEDSPNTVANVFNIIQTCSSVIGNQAINEVYSRDDDDLGQNKVEAKYFNNETSLALGKTATISETRVNPIIRTLSLFLPKNIQEA